jgi:hypothetical protein
MEPTTVLGRNEMTASASQAIQEEEKHPKLQTWRGKNEQSDELVCAAPMTVRTVESLENAVRKTRQNDR